MISEIISAAAEPLTTTEAWYGVLAALAFNKQIKSLGDSVYLLLKGKINKQTDTQKGDRG